MEMLIGVAILGIITAATATSVAQVFTGSRSSSNQMTAINNVRNAGDWIVRDAQQARAKESVIGSGMLTATAPPPDNEIKLIWYNYDPSYPTKKWYRVIYTIPAGTTDLQRTEDIGTYSNGVFVPTPNTSQTVIVARNVTSVTRSLDTTNSINVLTITITASAGPAASLKTETRTFEIKLRPQR